MISLKKILREALNEFSTRKKELFGAGVEHKIYPSSDPNKLYKVGYCDSISLFLKAVNADKKILPSNL